MQFCLDVLGKMHKYTQLIKKDFKKIVKICNNMQVEIKKKNFF